MGRGRAATVEPVHAAHGSAPLSTVSGAEAQRLKLARELARGGATYVLDEPTTGLHMADIDSIVAVFQKLVDGGNSVLVIEHNLDVIRQADWVIDMGPRAGKEGGRIVAQGSPEEVASTSESVTGLYLREMLYRSYPSDPLS